MKDDEIKLNDLKPKPKGAELFDAAMKCEKEVKVKEVVALLIESGALVELNSEAIKKLDAKMYNIVSNELAQTFVMNLLMKAEPDMGFEAIAKETKSSGYAGIMTAVKEGNKA